MDERDISRYAIDIESFSPTYGAIDLHAGLVLHRGYSTKYPAVGRRPAFFSTNRVMSEAYAEGDDCEIGRFVTTRPLRFYDLRFLKAMLRDIFPQRKSNSRDVIESCNTLALAYGTCSLRRQLELFAMRYPQEADGEPEKSMLKFRDFIEVQPTLSGVDPVEAQGIRIAETTNDAEAVLLLREMFGNTIDGYIVPRLYSPYHTEKKNCMMTSEVLTFNPVASDIKQVEDCPDNCEVVEKTSWLSSFRTVTFPLKGFDGPRLVLHEHMGGSRAAKESNRYDPRNALFDRGGKKVEAMEKRTRRFATKLGLDDRNTYDENRSRLELPNPTCEVAPWII
jgi:hypothetical protein